MPSEMQNFFLDTNVLVYFFDAADINKQQIAWSLLQNSTSKYVISTQVLTEFSNVALHKLKLTVPQLHLAIDKLSELPLVNIEVPALKAAAEISKAYQLSFYDSLIVASAEVAGCSRIVTEDLNNGQKIRGMEIWNPFATLATGEIRSHPSAGKRRA